MKNVTSNNNKNTNKYNNRKYLYFAIMGLFLLVGISYAIIFFMEKYESSNLGMQTDLLDVSITENGLVAIDDAITQKDSEGLENDKTTFTINNDNDVPIRVIIKLNIDHNSTLDINYVRFGVLNNNSIVNVGNLGESDGILYDFFIEPRQNITLQSTLWLDYFYEGGNTNEAFSGKYNVLASNADQFAYMYLAKLVNKNKGLYAINDDGTLNTGTGSINEYRYSGLTPDNYVYFNNELWRIIGLFDGKIKIVRNDEISIASYVDNNTYYETIDDISKEYIETSQFKTGGVNLTNTYTTLLTNEQTANIEGNVNYISASDYLYSTDPTYYTSALNSTDVSSNTWLTGTYLTVNGILGSENVLGINANIPTSVLPSDTNYNIKPCLYLKKTVFIVGGYGTLDKPYELSYVQ